MLDEWTICRVSGEALRSASRSAALMQIVLIAAVADNGVIGRGGTMPWRLKSDMRHFRALTIGKPVVMGRKTYLVARDQAAAEAHQYRGHAAMPRFTAPGVLVAPSLEAALAAARGDALRRGTDDHGDRRRRRSMRRRCRWPTGWRSRASM